MNEDSNWDEPYAYWLANVPGIGNRMKRKLSAYGKNARAVYEMPEKELVQFLSGPKAEKMVRERRRWDVEGEYGKLQEKGVNFVSLLGPSYPEKLAAIEDAPFGLYFHGRLPAKSVPSVAIIGARECSEYGRYIAGLWGSQLAQEGVALISGMARGIDSIGQKAALEAGGNSYAVLGCGADICYPAENREIYERMKTQGGILSEYSPGTGPKPQLFPPRNRIISGLSDVVVIIEAREKSGTLITADMALEQGKEVYVLPGRATDSLSEGCNRLIKQGAGLMLSVSEMLEETGLREKKKRWEAELSGTEAYEGEERHTKLEKCLDFYPKSIEQLQEESGMEYREIICRLMSLCMDGEVKQVSAGFYQKAGKYNIRI